MFTKLINYFNFLCVLVVLPVLVGCDPSSSSSSGSGSGALASSSVGTGADFATIHNPEPTTMLLLGGGMMAMAYYKNKMGKK